MYSMWEVHHLVAERHTTLLHDRRESLRCQLKEMPSQDREAWIDAVLLDERDTRCQLQAVSMQDRDRRAARNRWGWLAALFGHRHVRQPEAAQR
jgi:hypothetical protein